jgi:hypothetical protein
MGLYPGRSMERAMRFQEVILRAVSKQISWMQAAEILGMSDRNMRRYRNRLEKGGYDGLIDRRTQRPSPKRVPMAEVGRSGATPSKWRRSGRGRSGATPSKCRVKRSGVTPSVQKVGRSEVTPWRLGALQVEGSGVTPSKGSEKWGHTFGTGSGEK